MVVANFFECFEGQCQRSKVNSIEWTLHAYSGDFSYNDDSVRLK